MEKKEEETRGFRKSSKVALDRTVTYLADNSFDLSESLKVKGRAKEEKKKKRTEGKKPRNKKE